MALGSQQQRKACSDYDSSPMLQKHYTLCSLLSSEKGFVGLHVSPKLHFWESSRLLNCIAFRENIPVRGRVDINTYIQFVQVANARNF